MSQQQGRPPRTLQKLALAAGVIAASATHFPQPLPEQNLSDRNETGPQKEAAFNRPTKERKRQDSDDSGHEEHDFEQEGPKLPDRKKRKELERKRSR